MIQKRFILLLSLVLFVAPLSGCARNPVTGSQEIMLMSRSEEIKMGREYYPLMTQMYDGELQGQALQNYVERLGFQLAKVSDAPNYPYQFNVVNTSIPNAYALPGGFISVTRGLLLEMESEGELAAVLGHEIVHVTARHTAQRYTRGVFASLLLTAGDIYLQTEGGASAGLYRDLANIGAQAMLASYSRSQEEMADRVGMRYMAKAGYDPSGMVDLQKLLLDEREKEPGLMDQLFASHPLTEDRIDYSLDQAEIVRREVKSPRGNQLNRFEELVAQTWKPRRSAYAQYDEGMKQLDKGNLDAAKASFRTAIDGYEGEGLFHAGLGYVLTEQGELQDGRSSLDRALQLNRDVFRVQLYSGINFFELGQHANSLKNLSTADSLLAGVPATVYYRGRNYEALGNRNAAAKAYREYLQKAPKGEFAGYCRKRLKEWN